MSAGRGRARSLGRGRPLVGVVGLGIMGGAMARHLATAGYSLVGYDPAANAQRRFARCGGEALGSARAVAEQADLVITSLATASALEQATEAIVGARRARARPRLIVIETSTLPLADKARADARLRRAGMTALDCPISGTAVRLKERAWTIFVSGPRQAHARVRELLAVFTDQAPYVGRYGNGTRMKLVANHLVAILNVATAESLTFARRMGLDARTVHALMGSSPVIGTGVYRLRGGFMVERTYLPATMKVEVWQKDMQVIGDTARAVGAPVPLFSGCVPLYNAAMARGLAASDSASVCAVFDAMTGAIAPAGRPRNG
ncbi:MAG: NAD(P)-dependent oxidoreductase [Burkholderiales bacterium]|nr:NAD(P)-dependent oxidoreductase [Burkholderiales bacterium]